MTGSIAPNRPGHHGTMVARTVGTVAISCNVVYTIIANTFATLFIFVFFSFQECGSSRLSAHSRR